MPPPKKPKTGTSWVQDFLSANNSSELRQRRLQILNEQATTTEVVEYESKYCEEQECSQMFLSSEKDNNCKGQESFNSKNDIKQEEEDRKVCGVSQPPAKIDNCENDTQVISDNLVSSSRYQVPDIAHKKRTSKSHLCIVLSDEEDNSLYPQHEAKENCADKVCNDDDTHSKVQSSLLLEKFFSSESYLKIYSDKLRKKYSGLNNEDSKVHRSTLGDYDVWGDTDCSCNKESGRNGTDTEQGTSLKLNPDSCKQTCILTESDTQPEKMQNADVSAVDEQSFKGTLHSDNQQKNLSEIEPMPLPQDLSISSKMSVNEKITGRSRVRKVESLMMRRQLDSLLDVSRPADITTHLRPTQCLAAMVQKVQASKFAWKHDSVNHSSSATSGCNALSPLNNNKKNGWEGHTKMNYKSEKPYLKDTSRESNHIIHKYLSASIDTNNPHDVQFSRKDFVQDVPEDSTSNGPITKLENMCYSDTKMSRPNDSSYTTFKNSFSVTDFPYVYQRISNISGFSDDKNKTPHSASSGEIILDSGISSKNINNCGTRRPSWLLPQPGHVNVNHKQTCSTKRPPFSTQQNINSNSAVQAESVNNSVSVLTSREQKKEMENYHKRILLQTVLEGTHDERPPPLLPISNIMHTSDMQRTQGVRELADPEYEKQAVPTTLEDTLMMTANSNLTPISSGNSCPAHYSFPHPGFSPGLGPRTFTRSDSYSSDSPPADSGRNLLNLPAKNSSSIYKSASCPTMSEEPKFTGPIPNPLKSPPFLLQLRTVSNTIKVDSTGENVISSACSANVAGSTGIHGSNVGSSQDQHQRASPSPPQRQMDVPSSTVDLKKKTVEDRAHGRRCQICNDNASGFHYGVWSCEGCKAFFKRSLQGPVDYVCPSTNSCTIDKQRRKSCQACRLRKCMEMGMSRLNCRKERKPSKLAGPKRKADSSDSLENMGPSDSKLMKPDGITSSLNHPNSLDSSIDSNMTNTEHSSHVPFLNYQSIPQHPGAMSPPSHQQHQYSPNHQVEQSSTSPSSYHLHQQQQQHYCPQELQPSQPVANDEGFGVRGRESSDSGSRSAGSVCNGGAPLVQESSSISTSQLPIDPLVEHLLRIDPPMRASGHDSNKCETEMHLMTLLMRLADTELVDVINWAKSIPGYAELAFKDRVHLLELCWMEILILGILWHTLNSSETTPLGETFVMASDLVFDRSKFEEVNMWHIGCQLQSYLQEMANLHVNQEEFVLLRALVLVNSDRSSGDSKDKISALRSRILKALHYTTIERYHGAVSKVMNLLTLLPHIRQLGQQWISHFVRCKGHDQLATYGLLKEMTDAYLSCVNCAYCETSAFKGQHSSQESRSSSVEPNGTISGSPSLSPQSDLNI